MRRMSLDVASLEKHCKRLCAVLFHCMCPAEDRDLARPQNFPDCLPNQPTAVRTWRIYWIVFGILKNVLGWAGGQ